jgi:hypothetical protein
MEEIRGKYGCRWSDGTGNAPDGTYCGECYPDYEDKCHHLKKQRQIEEFIDAINDVDDNGYAYDNEGYEITGCANSRKIAEALYDADYRKQSDVAVEIIDEFKQIAKQFVLDRDLYLVAFKNALDYAEAELKKKYMETNTYENNT